MKLKTAIKLGIIFGLLFWWWSCNSPPSDKSLLKLFQTHRESLEKLRTMLQEDRKLDYVGDSARVATELIARGSTREGDYAERRYREYVKLIKEAHVIDAVRGKDGFLFPVKDWGAMGEGWTVGLVWMEGPPRADLGRTYKPIEGHWYLWKEERWIALEDKRAKLPPLSLSGKPKTP